MLEFTEIPVGDIGRDFMLSRLGGESGMAKTLHRFIERGDGETRAIVPSGTSRERLEKFEVGGLCARSAAMKWLLATRQRTQRFVVIQDLWAAPEDPHPTVSGVERITTGRSVYYAAPLQALSESDFSLIINRLISFHFLVIFSRSELPCGPKFDAKYISDIVVDAYDQESFVVWRATQA